MWRIVLLYKKCTKRVNSSELCPYCFSAVVDEQDRFKCRDFRNSTHKGCISQYGSVCVDCWIPGAVANSIRSRRRKFRKRKSQCCKQAATLPESRVSGGETNEFNSFAEQVEGKVVAAAKAGENARRRDVAAKNVVDLARGVLSVVASRNVAESCETKVVEAAELAFLLHRVVDSSSGISRYACLRSSFNNLLFKKAWQEDYLDEF